jgi:hypothetical protein
MTMNLGSLRSALLARARAEAGSRLAAARSDADHQRSEARAEAAALLQQVATERDASTEAARRLGRVRARRQAQALVLRARRGAYDDLRATAMEAAARLRAGPRYQRLRERLAAAASDQLGAGAELSEPEGGGIVGLAGDRLVDYSLPTLVERCLAALGPDLEELWQ